MKTNQLPSALDEFSSVLKKFKGRKPIFFLDYDGTLTPIVAHYNEAILSDSMHQALLSLASQYPVAIISGRNIDDVRHKVNINGIIYAGCHGFEIEGPHGMKKVLPKAKKYIPLLKKAEQELEKLISHFDQAVLEYKGYSLAIHFRNVEKSLKGHLKGQVESLCQGYRGLKLKPGKEVFDLEPDMDWDKGKAVLWLLDQISMKPSSFPMYIGDDFTDEDAFRALGQIGGLGIIVSDEEKETCAHCILRDPGEVEIFIKKFIMEKNWI